MNRRKDGRELFEVFKETINRPSPPRPEARPAAERQPAQAPVAQRSPDEPDHVIRLGDRCQVLVTLSSGWIYGLSLFAIVLLAAAFMTGRRFAPVPEPVKEVQAPDQFVQEAARVGDIERLSGAPLAAAPAPADTFAVFAPAQPAPLPPAEPAPVTGQGTYALCFVTYTSKSDRAKGEEVVNFLRAQGFSDARVLGRRGSNKLIVAVGAFATTEAPEVKDLKVRLSTLSFRGAEGKFAYPVSLRDYE